MVLSRGQGERPDQVTQGDTMNRTARQQAAAKAATMTAKLSDEALAQAWMVTEIRADDERIQAMVRGWMMDEIQTRLGDDLFDELADGRDRRRQHRRPDHLPDPREGLTHTGGGAHGAASLVSHRGGTSEKPQYREHAGHARPAAWTPWGSSRPSTTPTASLSTCCRSRSTTAPATTAGYSTRAPTTWSWWTTSGPSPPPPRHRAAAAIRRTPPTSQLEPSRITCQQTPRPPPAPRARAREALPVPPG